MKKLFTLLTVGVLALASNAQSVAISNADVNGAASRYKIDKLPTAKPFKSSGRKSAGRATTTSIVIDYNANEAAYANDNAFNTGGFGAPLNRNFPNSNAYTFRNATMFVDSLVENTDDFQTHKTRYYPKKESTITIKGFYFLSIYDKNAPAIKDTFKMSIFKIPANYAFGTNFGGLRTGSGASSDLNTAPVTIWADSSYEFVPDSFAVFKENVQGTDFWYLGDTLLNIQLNKGETFGVKIEFKSDTSNSLRTLVSYFDKCQGAEAATTALYQNFAPYVNLQFPNGNFSGIFDNNVYIPSYSPQCDRLEFQNTYFTALVDVTVDEFIAGIAPSSTESCPGGQVDLKANYVGSSQATFQWSSKTGILSASTDEEVTLTMPNTNQNDTVTLIATDSSGLVNDTAVIIIKTNGIGIAVNNNNPISVNCGTLATAITSVTGYTTGRTYQWNIDTDPLVDTTTTSSGTGNRMGGLYPGTYSVTVTNDRGCQASTNFTVQYANGVTNTAAFTTPDVVPTSTTSYQMCVNLPGEFKNTSSSTDGWVSNWTFGDASQSTSTDQDPVFVYTAVGNYQVNLVMDSAGCKFLAPSKTVQVLAATSAACGVGVNEIAFDNSVELVPNPNNGTVTIAVSNVEKGLSIRVYNILGSEVKQFVSKDANGSFAKTFDFTDLAKGAYLVKVQAGNKSAVKRMIINK